MTEFDNFNFQIQCESGKKIKSEQLLTFVEL